MGLRGPKKGFRHRGDFARFARKGMSVGGAMPASPTTAYPGTIDKIKVMAERASRGESCFHQLDAKDRWADRGINTERIFDAFREAALLALPSE